MVIITKRSKGGVRMHLLENSQTIIKSGVHISEEVDLIMLLKLFIILMGIYLFLALPFPQTLTVESLHTPALPRAAHLQAMRDFFERKTASYYA